MSKIADALNRIQQNQENSKDSSGSVFVHAVDEKIRPHSKYEALASVMMVLRPLVLLASIAVVMVVFSYGVRQGMKIEKAIANTPESSQREASAEPAMDNGYYLVDAPVEAESAASPVLPALAEDAGPVTVQPVVQVSAVGGEGLAPVIAPAAAPRVAPVREDGRFTVQLVTYVSASRASEEVEKLKGQGYQPFVIPSGKHHQVCVNRFQERDQASEFLDKIRKDGLLKTYPGAYIRTAGS